MGQITFDCPHVACVTKNSAFTMIQSHGLSLGTWDVFAVCASCGQAIVLRCFETLPNRAAPHSFGGQNFVDNFRIAGAWPEPPKIEMIGALPADVADIFLEAEQNFVDKRPRTAAMGYRAAIETALHHLNPNGEGMLAARIKQMKDVLPGTLIDLLGHVKFLGNDAAHKGTPDAEDVAAGRDFARLFFVYTFELPARVADAAARRMMKP